MTALLDRHIEQTPGVRGGRPRIAGTRISVSDIAIMHLKLGEALPQIAGTYGLSLAAVHAAMAFYFDHREEIDRRIAEDEEFAEAFRQNHRSPLQEKLRAIGHG